MYTQCPDCETAFKVTAEVLKQAAGKVRCGGCGHAFNALAYLSEQMPKQPVVQAPNEALPELKPEIIDTDDGLPKSISAKQSAALLKTLDQLAGSDIRIEDTGVEWRVLDEQEAAAPAAGDDDAGLHADANTVDEFLDDSETPIDEFLTATPEVVDAPEIFEDTESTPAKAAIDELRFDDNTPLPDDFDLDDQSSYDSEPPLEEEEDVAVDAVAEEPQLEVTLSEPDEWTDILGEFQDLAEEIATPIEEEAAAVGEVENRPAEESGINQPLDMDTQFALQAVEMGIDLSGVNELDEDSEEDVEEDPEKNLEVDLGEKLEENLEVDLGEKLEENLEVDLGEELEENLEVDVGEKLEEQHEEEVEDDLEDDLEEDTEEEVEPELEEDIAQLDLIDDHDEQETLIDEPIVESHTIETELAAAEEPIEHYVPPMTDEEHTVNMQIDQDLMALAIEDEDGFTSTIVIPEKNAEKKAHEEKTAKADDESEKPDDKSGFETIIMEGEFVRSAQDAEKLAADKAAAAELAELARAREAEQAKQSGGGRYGMIAGVVVLVLLLVIQIMHQSREALATIPAFSNTVGQVYRAIGKPVQPAWDITGWRFEATKGSTEGDEEELTVYSRLGNNSEGPLPYPLIGISLTDRFEETIGSRMLDPAEYLPTDLDPRKLVEPGNTFNAVITIKSTSEDATGFKLNVCYRLSDGQLRCAIDDFL